MLQGIIVYMFGELVGYCASMIGSSGHYSSAIQHTSNALLLGRQCLPSSLSWWGVPGIVAPKESHQLDIPLAPWTSVFAWTRLTWLGYSSLDVSLIIVS